METQESYLNNKLLECMTGDIIKFTSSDPNYNKEAIYIADINGEKMFELINNKEKIKITLEESETNVFKITDMEFLYRNISKPVSENIDIISNDVEYEDYEDSIKHIRELSIWEREWSYNELKLSIIDSLSKNNILSYDYISNKAEKILDTILNVTPKKFFDMEDIENKPAIHNFINNNYRSLLKPLVYDSKKIYTKSSLLLNPEDDSIVYNDVIFTEPTHELLGSLEHFKKYNKNEIDKDTYDNELHNTFQTTLSINTPINSINDTVHYSNINLSHIPTISPTDTYYKSSNINNYTNLYRISNNSFLINKGIDTIKNKSILETRLSEPDQYRLYDRLTDRLIGDRKSSKSLGIKSCHTSGVGSDTFYSGAKDKKSHKINAFNKSIIVPPQKNIFIEGESLTITGLVIKSIKNWKPDFTSADYTELESTINKSGYQILQKFEAINNYGYNLIDQININNINLNNPQINSTNIENYTVIDSIDSVNVNSIDFSKNNLIYFNKNKNEQIGNIEKYLDNVVPNIDDIFNNIEKETLKQCNNFTDINKILNKYNLSIFNTHSRFIKKINVKTNFLQNVDRHLDFQEYTSLKYLESKHNYSKYTTINKILNSIISKLDNDLEKTYRLDQHQTYIDNLILASEKILFNTLNSQFTTQDLMNYIINELHIHISYEKSISDSGKMKLLIHTIVTYLINNKYTINYFKNNFYSFIPNKLSNKILQKKLENLITIYNLDSSLSTIEIINKLNESFDSGDLLYRFIVNINNTNQLLMAKTQILNIAKTNYLNSVDIDNWNSLDETDKNKWIPNITSFQERYEDRLRLYNEQKKLYNYYLQKCNSFEVVKIYKTLQDLQDDNQKTDKYYDELFDTTTYDCNLAQKLIKDYNNVNGTTLTTITSENEPTINKELNKLYIFDSDKELELKLENIKQNLLNDKKQRLIQDGQYSLLHTDNTRILYKLIKGVWITLTKEELMSGSIINKKTQLETILELDFKQLLMDSSSDTDYESKGQNILSPEDKKCIRVDNIRITELEKNKCIPRKFIKYLYEANHEYIEMQHLKDLVDQKDSIQTIIDTNNLYISESIDKKLKLISKNVLEIKEEPVVSKSTKKTVPINLLDKFKNANNISDPDIRLSSLKNIIENYGVFNKPILDSDIQEPQYTSVYGNEPSYTTGYGATNPYGSTNPYGVTNPYSATNTGYSATNTGYGATNTGYTTGYDYTTDYSNYTPQSPEYRPQSPDYSPSKEGSNKLGGAVTEGLGSPTYLPESPTYSPHSPTYFPGSYSSLPEDNYIYWDYPDTSEIMCCKHYLDLIDMAWVDNSVREEKLKQLEFKYARRNIIDGDRKVCDICGEELIKIDYSDFEGFSGQDRPVKFRELVIDEYIDITYTEQEKNIKQVLDLYTRNIGIQLTDNDTEFIIKSSSKLIESDSITLQQYFDGETPVINSEDEGSMFNGYSEGSVFINKGKEKGFLKAYYEDYELLNEYININKLDINDFSEKNDQKIKNDMGLLESSSPKLESLKNIEKFFKFMRTGFIPFYLQYIDALKITIIISYLLLTIFYAVPSYQIIGSGDERIAKIKFIGLNSSNEKEGISYLIKNITGKFIQKNSDTAYIKWTLLRNRYKKIDNKEKQYNEFLDRHFNSIYTKIKNFADILNIKSKKDEDILNRELFLENIVENETNWIQFRPSLVTSYEYEETLNTSALIDEYKQVTDKLNELKQVVSEQPDKITELFDTINLLELLKIKLLDVSRKLGYKLIVNINTFIHAELNPSNITSPIIPYTSNCCQTKIWNNYMDYFITIDSNINNLLIATKQINNVLKHNYTNEFIISFNENKNNRDGTNSRKLLDYLYIDRSLFESEENYLSYLKDSYMQINYTNVTSQFVDLTNINIGKQRIWKKQFDKDVYLLNDILEQHTLTNPAKITSTELELNLIEQLKIIYPLMDSAYLENKAKNLINNKGLIEIDIVTTETKEFVTQKINTFLDSKSIDELIIQLNIINTESRLNKIISKSLNSVSSSIIDKTTVNFYYQEQINKIKTIETLVNKSLFDQSLLFSTELISIIKNIDSYPNVSEDFLKIYNKYYKFSSDMYDSIIDNMFLISASLKSTGITKDTIRTIMYNVGNYNSIYEENLNYLEERLTIEDYIGEERDQEEAFRQTELNKFKIYKNITLVNSYSTSIITMLSSIRNRLDLTIKGKANASYLEGYNKAMADPSSKKTIIKKNRSINPWWIEENYTLSNRKCVCPYPTTIYNELTKTYNDNYYKIIDDCIDELIEDTTQCDQLIELLNTFLSNSGDLYKLISTIDSNVSINNVDYISALDENYMLILSKYIFYHLCQFMFVTIYNASSNGEILSKYLYDFLFNENIHYSEIIKDITDNNIISKIDIYKSVQNRYRKTRSDKMSNEERSVQQLFRKFNLGNMYGAFDNLAHGDTADITEFNIEVEPDITDNNLEKELGSSEAVDLFKDQQQIMLEEDESFMGTGMAQDHDGNTDDYE